MKIHRFIGDFELKAGELRIEDRELFNQTRNVLKLRVGEKIVLGDGKMNEGEAEILEYGKDFVRVNIGDIKMNQNEPDAKVVLYCAILKKENFELVVQKATEVGVAEIVPLITSRTIKLDIRKDRLGKIIREAAEQSGRGIVPILHNPIKFEDAVQNVTKDKGINIIFDISGNKIDTLTTLAGQANPLLLTTSVWVGPEGGWSPEEIESARQVGFKITNLGKTTLRAETAAIVASYLAIHPHT